MAGKSAYAHFVTAIDIYYGAPDVGRSLNREYEEALTSGRFAAILDTSFTALGPFRDTLEKLYPQRELAVQGPSAMYPKTGWRQRPEVLWLRKQAP